MSNYEFKTGYGYPHFGRVVRLCNVNFFFSSDELLARYLLGQDAGYPAVNFDSKDSADSINDVRSLDCFHHAGDHENDASLESRERSRRPFQVYLTIPTRVADSLRVSCNSLIRTIGAASTVLLKNTANALPLKAPKSIAIIGIWY